jgi:hypothetical protein
MQKKSAESKSLLQLSIFLEKFLGKFLRRISILLAASSCRYQIAPVDTGVLEFPDAHNLGLRMAFQQKSRRPKSGNHHAFGGTSDKSPISVPTCPLNGGCLRAEKARSPRAENQNNASAAHAVFAGVDGGARFAVGFTAALGFALVPVLLALGDGQFAFDAPIAEVKAGGDERVPLHLRLRE